MENELRRHLLACANAFKEHEGCKISRVGAMAALDRLFFDRIQSASFTIRTYDRVMKWFDRNWPDGLAWPADVPRASSKNEAA